MLLATLAIGCSAKTRPPAQSVALHVGGELAAWSPDGSLIAAPEVHRITLLRPDGSVERRFPVRGVQPASRCECMLGWSRDSGQVLFLTRRGSTDREATVGSLDVESGRVRERPLGVPAGDAAWSPDGWPLVFVANSGAYEFGTAHRGPRPDLWRLDGLGAEPHRILRQPGNELHPRFSPDGSQVLYLRKDSGRRTPWVVERGRLGPAPGGPWLDPGEGRLVARRQASRGRRSPPRPRPRRSSTWHPPPVASGAASTPAPKRSPSCLVAAPALDHLPAGRTAKSRASGPTAVGAGSSAACLADQIRRRLDSPNGEAPRLHRARPRPIRKRLSISPR